jgi:hypothetical protein
VGVALGGATGVVVSSFLPWARSGSADRDSYQLVAAAERLELLSPPLQRVALAWYLVVVAVGVAWLAAGMHRHLLAAGACAATGSLALLLSVATMASPLRALTGTPVAAASGGIALLGSIAVIGTTLRQRRAAGRSGHGPGRASEG